MPAEFFDAISTTHTPPRYKFFDGVTWRESESGKTIPIISPIDARNIGEVQAVTHAEIDAIFTRARDAQHAWELTPLHTRVKIVHLAADWIRHYEEYLAQLLSNEIGKILDDAKAEIIRTADLIDYFADEAQSLKGETLDSDNFPGYDKGRIAMIERAAHGIIVAIGPFNYPVNLSASKIAPALLMGNAVIFKPPTQGSISGAHLAYIFHKAGLPEGVLSCITGSGSDVGNYTVGHSDVDMVAFTGSSESGKAIASKAGMVPLLFECGGNNPAVVFADADLQLTAREIVKGGFSYAGQRCTAIKYVLSTPAVFEQLTPLVLQMCKELVKAGDPRHPETKLVGPVISESAAGEIEALIEQSVHQGATVLMGGKRNNTYMEPTILTGVTAEMATVATEVFGPVISFITIEKMEDAVRIINNSKFGLQASVFTKDEGTGIAFAQQLRVGTVQINGSPQRGPDHFPFLGIKASGVGVQGVRYSLESMSRLKPVVINKPV